VGKDDAAFLQECKRTLERELEDTRSKADQAQRKMESVWNIEKSAWALERALLEQERGKWTAMVTATAELEEKLEEEHLHRALCTNPHWSCACLPLGHTRM
jgi:hypothetical protein